MGILAEKEEIDKQHADGMESLGGFKNFEKPILTLQEAQAVVATKTAPKVTKESIEAKIADVHFIYHSQLTICIITMKNGFMVNGQSAPASMENYDANVGKTYAYENAFKQLWVLEGYLLREQLHYGSVTGRRSHDL